MPKPARFVVCVRCNRLLKHHCKEMCRACYSYMKRLARAGTCEACHRECHGIMGGLCGTCRMRAYRERTEGYRQRHADSERARRKQFADEYHRRDHSRYITHREQRLAYNRSYYQKNADRLRSYQSDYRKSHPGWSGEVKRRYRLRKRNLAITLTTREWEAIKDGFDHRCVYCNRRMDRLTRDHIIPVTKGGPYTPDNIIPACPSCNSRKHTKDAFEFLLSM